MILEFGDKIGNENVVVLIVKIKEEFVKNGVFDNKVDIEK